MVRNYLKESRIKNFGKNPGEKEKEKFAEYNRYRELPNRELLDSLNLEEIKQMPTDEFVTYITGLELDHNMINQILQNMQIASKHPTLSKDPTIVNFLKISVIQELEKLKNPGANNENDEEENNS